MKYDPFKYHRRSIRLRGYDYSQAGAYFVTICAQNRECLFGEVVDGEMELNDAGAMLVRWWDELPNKFPAVESDAFVVMPNHIHGIVVIADDGQPRRVAPTEVIADVGATLRGRPIRGRPDAPTRPTLGDIMDWFKTMTTNEYIRGVKQRGWKPFDKRVFQRNYYEHIVRNERELNAIREYIQNNPANWMMDMDNTKNVRQLPAPEIIDDYLRDLGIS
ncbi:MAG: hypothetical protein LC737_07975 [Chloroflexi bacterium]|nr:hypothetical protein [Chloroflexota bacterium]